MNTSRVFAVSVLVFVLMAGVTACSRSEPRDMSTIVDYYAAEAPGESTLAFRKNIDTADRHTPRQLERDKWRVSRLATVLGDIFLTLDYIEENQFPANNRKSLKKLLGLLDYEIGLIFNDKDSQYQKADKYRNLFEGAFESVKGMVERDSSPPGTIRKMIESDILRDYFGEHFFKTYNCDQCYTYDNFLAHIGFRYYMISRKLFKDDIHDGKKICQRPVSSLVDAFARRILDVLEERAKILQDKIDSTPDRNEFMWLLDPYGKGISRVERDGDKIRYIIPLRPGVDSVLEHNRKTGNLMMDVFMVEK